MTARPLRPDDEPAFQRLLRAVYGDTRWDVSARIDPTLPPRDVDAFDLIEHNPAIGLRRRVVSRGAPRAPRSRLRPRGDPPPPAATDGGGAPAHRSRTSRPRPGPPARRGALPRRLAVLMAHWGFEYVYWPAARQREDALRLVVMGVDVIVGSSPHVLQPVVVVSVDGAGARCSARVTRGGAPGFALVAWSLGNLATIMPTPPCQVGALLSVTLGRSAIGARTVDLSELRRLGGDVGAALAHARHLLGDDILEDDPWAP